MPRIGRSSGNSSKEGSRGGSNSTPKSMKGKKLAQRLPHLSPVEDGTLSISTKGIDVSGHQTTSFTTPVTSNFTVPPNVDTLTITMYGGGGGGANAGAFAGTGPGGGGGAKLVLLIDEIAPGTILSFTVGTGGNTGTRNTLSGNGGDTILRYLGVGYTAGGGCGCMGRDGVGTTGGTCGLAQGVMPSNDGTVTLTHGNTGHRGAPAHGTGGFSVLASSTYGLGGSGAPKGSVHASVAGYPGAVIIT